MAGRGEISWKTRTPEGERREVRVQRTGRRWDFSSRTRRFERWQPVPDPSLEDWERLLDGLERRRVRRLCRPEEIAEVRRLIQAAFPQWTPDAGAGDEPA